MQTSTMAKWCWTLELKLLKASWTHWTLMPRFSRPSCVSLRHPPVKLPPPCSSRLSPLTTPIRTSQDVAGGMGADIIKIFTHEQTSRASFPTFAWAKGGWQISRWNNSGYSEGSPPWHVGFRFVHHFEGGRLLHWGGAPTFHLGWSCSLWSDNFIASSHTNVLPHHLDLRERPSPELLSLSEHSQKNWPETKADVVDYGMSFVTCSKHNGADHALKRAELERKLKNASFPMNRWP